ncbi:hypothetical protein CEXT_348391 [Caerostris extrusa]|uniref:Uncharacterized protein n=1 Tax=Caerostris extrusa TaxID=172846 RepID=A0AAV4Q5E6_CAEEX|nr:hypothetical protein CEXT_348391 [Caerostris extrusa]
MRIKHYHPFLNFNHKINNNAQRLRKNIKDHFLSIEGNLKFTVRIFSLVTGPPYHPRNLSAAPPPTRPDTYHRFSCTQTSIIVIGDSLS